MLTIIIPVFNAINTIEKILNQIDQVDFIPKEIILVDDSSTDGTKSLIENHLANKVTKVIYHKNNKGKGSAIKSAQKFIKGDYVIIQDADLEYNPNDYYSLLKPIIDGKYNVVYGSRVLGKNRYKLKNFTSIFRIFANHLLTLFSNFINNQNLTDAHTCYKVFSSKIIKDINLQEDGFNFCPEVTTKIAKLNLKIMEVPIDYYGRTISEGKKMQFFEGFRAIYCLIKYKFISE